MFYNAHIGGLVTRRSSIQRTAKPIGERASSKLTPGVSPLCYVVAKPKARSPMGFLRCGRNTRQGALANGLHGLNPQNTGTSYLLDDAEKPLSEGLRKGFGQSGDKQTESRLNRCVMRAVGLLQIEIKDWQGKETSRFTLARPME